MLKNIYGVIFSLFITANSVNAAETISIPRNFLELDAMFEALSQMPKNEALLKLNEMVGPDKDLDEYAGMLRGLKTIYSYDPQQDQKIDTHDVASNLRTQLSMLSSDYTDIMFEKWAHGILDLLPFSENINREISLLTSYFLTNSNFAKDSTILSMACGFVFGLQCGSNLVMLNIIPSQDQ